MTSTLLFLFLFRLVVGDTQRSLSESIPQFQCPSAGVEVIVPPGKRIRLAKSTSDELCTLTRITDEKELAPVGRSYGGHDWENVAGPYNSLSYSCEEENSQYCEFTVPNSADSNQKFILKTFQHSLSTKDEIARFLEQNTFGTTQTELRELQEESESINNLQLTFAKWVYRQMNDVKPSLHREFWRRHTLPRQVKAGIEGKPTHPCGKNSRWRTASFTKKDIENSIYISSSSGRYSISIYGFILTYVDSFSIGGIDVDLKETASYEICSVEEEVGGKLGLIVDNKCRYVVGGNPPINFEWNDIFPEFVLTLPDPDSQLVLSKNSQDKVTVMVLEQGLDSDLCKGIPLISWSDDETPVFGRDNNGEFFVHDSRLILESNNIQDPLPDGGGATLIDSDGAVHCSNAPRTFLNEEHCVLSNEPSSCMSSVEVDGKLYLNETSIVKLFHATERHIHAIGGLRLNEDYLLETPCMTGSRSRWKRKWNGDCITNVETETSQVFIDLIQNSLDENPIIKDVVLPESRSCHPNDKDVVQITIEIGKMCFTNVHPDFFNVYDFTYWTQKDTHPGNEVSALLGKRNPIKKFAETGSEKLVYPRNHPMARWSIHKKDFPFIGRFGDAIDFQDLPSYLRSNVVAQVFDLISDQSAVGGGIVVCGSPGEVANDLTQAKSFDITRSPDEDDLTRGQFHQQKLTVWTSMSIEAPDQLRQRMAWALAQILVISPSTNDIINTEVFLTYYDIFVRHAFGNYRDILREVAYSPMMADMLSYLGSKSTKYIWDVMKEIQYADENFAREVMQLFSTGLVKLNIDGTHVLDSNGNTIRVYDNGDIMDYARAWTGFFRRSGRGNVEERHDYLNSLDPLQIFIPWRDQVPKRGLDSQYVGDKYMLCDDLPVRAFLRTGAKYRLLGKSKIPELQNLLLKKSPEDSDINFIVLNKDQSELFIRLCNRSLVDEPCTYPSIVRIEENLKCIGIECDVQTIQVVQVDEDVFYEYIRPACVEFPFFNDGKIITSRDGSEKNICVNANSIVAAEACCENDNLVSDHQTCKYTSERVSYSTARQRCYNQGKSTCDLTKVKSSICGICCDYTGKFWTDDECHISILINPDGKIAISSSESESEDEMPLDYFRVNWVNDRFPNVEANGCDNGNCKIFGTRCRCKIAVKDFSVFSSVPSRDEVLSRLHIGGIPPEMFDSGTYSLSEQTSDGIRVYLKSNSINIDTIFELEDKYGRTLFLKNMVSTVSVGDNAGHTFRNSPSFFSAIPEKRDAEYETEAVLDHYFYHDSTAPFLALRFIQRFGISNPSPRYIKAVATAFQSGSFSFEHEESGIINYGSGEYGDLSSTIAAIVLDRESRNILLDADPTHGSLREPLIKIISLMRNLDFKLKVDNEFISLYDLSDSIGQMAHEIPSVFSFFLPEYSSPGPVMRASLVAPEALLLPSSLGLMNGMLSLVKFGLTACFGGFGNDRSCSKMEEGNFVSGYLSYKPSDPDDPDSVIEDLATLLTSGRMSDENRDVIKNAYFSVNGTDARLRLVQQLALSSPEYHSTGIINSSGEERKSRKSPSLPCKKYKAVVHILLAGGCDSFNLLVPHSQCDAKIGKDLYQEYANVRGSVSLKKDDLLPIDASSSNQPCSVFGLHPSLPVLQELYQNGTALFVANIGVLNKPVTKNNYMQETATQLFAHNAMQAEIGRLDPFYKSPGTGVLGRISDILHKKDFQVYSFSIDTSLVALSGRLENTTKFSMKSKTGPQFFNRRSSSDDFESAFSSLNNGNLLHSSIMSETWSSSLIDSFEHNKEYYWAYNREGKTSTSFPQTEVGNKLRAIARMIASSDCRGAERDIFYVEVNGYDHHSEMMERLNDRFIQLNDALDSFVSDLQDQGKFDDVAIVVTSDFGRTLSGNSGNGTDHAWSGHSFILGGNLNGGRILGDYPQDLTDESPMSVDRGRLIPSLPWEAIWNSVTQWLGITDESNLNEMLPNRNLFSDSLLSKNDIFLNDKTTEETSWCGNDSINLTCIPIWPAASPSPSPEISSWPTTSPSPSPEISLWTTTSPSQSPEISLWPTLSVDSNEISSTQTKNQSKDQSMKTIIWLLSLIVAFAAIYVVFALWKKWRHESDSKWSKVEEFDDSSTIFSNQVESSYLGTSAITNPNTTNQGSHYQFVNPQIETEISTINLYHFEDGEVEIALPFGEVI